VGLRVVWSKEGKGINDVTGTIRRLALIGFHLSLMLTFYQAATGRSLFITTAWGGCCNLFGGYETCLIHQGVGF
jgi:hypothetical protein